jgi:O-antigen ligase
MIDAVSIGRTGGRAAPPFGAVRLRTVVGAERLAVGTTAVAVAMLPLLVPSGPGHTAPVDGLIALALSVCLLWAGTSAHRLRFPYVVAMTLFIAGGALGAMSGPVPGTGALALLQDLVLLAWCWVVVNMSSSPQRLKILLGTWAYSSIAWAVLLFAGLAAGSSTVTGQSARQGGRTALTFVDPNISANYYFVSIMIIWATGRPQHRVLRLVAYVVLLAAMFTTGSNSGMVSLIVGIAVAALVGIYRRAGVVPAATTLAFLLLGGYLVASNVNFKEIQASAHESQYRFIREGIGRSSKSFQQRGDLLHESFTLYQTGGLLGQGPVSTKTRLESEMAPFVKEAHDDYFAAFIERGVLGVLGLLLLIAAVGRQALGLAKSRLAPDFGAVVIRPYALIGAVAGTLTVMAVYELLHVRQVWTLFAFLAALSVWGRE